MSKVEDKVSNSVGDYYHNNLRTLKSGSTEPLNIFEDGDRSIDLIYNDKNAKYQIYTFGCSYTYGWGLPQRKTFTHLLGDENTTVHNHGAGGTGLDFAVKTLSEVYIPTSTRQIFIITVPHYFRRTWFDDGGVVYKAWKVKEKVNINEYNNYFYFLHQYELLNRFVGRDKIIWGSWDWDEDLPQEMFDVIWDKVEDKADDDLHPGPKSHKYYAEKLKKIIEEKCK